jgi:FtsP/CotA-like multicopper oxidase with cupredoxin domain
MTRRDRIRWVVVGVIALAVGGVLAAGSVSAAPQAIELCAKAGDIGLPGGVTAPVWGFALKPDGVPCTAPTVEARVPGPVLDVAKDTDVTLTVHNALDDPVALDLPGLDVAEGPAVAAPGGTASYTFRASAPGTYLYMSAADAGRQSAMGLHGALVVRSGAAGQAYDGGPGTAFDREAVMVLGEIDPDFNADPAGFDMNEWAPSYWLINGKAYPQTADIPAQAGDRVLLRYVNPGPETVTMTMLGTNARLVARDANRLGNPFDVVAETIPAGATADEIAQIPAGAAAGSAFPLYNRQLHLTNGAPGAPQHSPGGMLTFIRLP